jgi:hypothetical protein
MDEVADKLAEMKANWKKNKEASKSYTGGGGTTLEVGNWEVVWKKGRLITYADTLAAIMEFEYAGEDIEHQGKAGVRFCGLDTDEKIIFFLSDLRKMECQIDEIDDPAQIKDIFSELDKRKPHMRSTVKKSKDGQYTNFYLDKLLSNDGEAEGVEGGEVDAKETEKEEELPENEEMAQLKAGDKIQFQYNQKTCTGVVDKIMEDDETLKVKCDQLKGRIVTINVGDNKVEMLVG